MPARTAAPSDTTAPGLLRRHAWGNPELTSHSLLALTHNRLYLAPLAGPPKSGTLSAIKEGTDPDELLGPLAVVIDFAAVRRLTLDLLTNSLVLEYAGGSGTSRQRVTFATPEAADACFAKLWRRVGDGLRLAPYRRDAWSLVRAPLLLLAGTLLATAALVLARSVFEDTAPARAAAAPRGSSPERALARLDWRLLCAAGGAAAGVTQVWLYRRLTAPPATLELVRT